MRGVFCSICIFSLISLFFLQTNTYAVQVLKGEATGKVMLNGEPWGTGKVTFTNVSGDASFVVNCEKDVSAGANSATCIGTNVNGFFSGGPNGYAIFGSGSKAITLQLVEGKKFTYAQSGVTAELEVTDPSIFKNWDAVSEDEPQYESEEYDPNAPLTDSHVRATDIDGQVEIACPPDFEAWDVLKPGRVIYNHCRLKTGEDSTLRISFSNMSSFVMRPETEIAINEATKEKSKLQLFFGGVWANIKKMAKGEEFGFKGSQAVAGIKGTTFILEETGTSTTLKVVEGVVSYTSLTSGKSVDVGEGKSVSATKEGLGAIGDFDREGANAYWNGIGKKRKDIYILVGVGAIVVILLIVSLLFYHSRRSKK